MSMSNFAPNNYMALKVSVMRHMNDCTFLHCNSSLLNDISIGHFLEIKDLINRIENELNEN